MAPSESDILTHYLLIPAPLTAIITLDQFRALFPATWQSSPQVAKLFRDLQSQRAQVVDKVTENIEAEARRGTLMRREVLRARMESEREDVDAEIDIERAVSTTYKHGRRARKSLLTHDSCSAIHRVPRLPSIPSAPSCRNSRTQPRPWKQRLRSYKNKKISYSTPSLRLSMT